MEQATKLTPELWELYNFIKKRTLEGLKTSVEDICKELTRYHLNKKESNFTNCPQLYEDIDTLNSSYELEKIIVKDYNNFHLATEEEAKKYRDKLQTRALKLMKKYWVIERKIEKNGSGKLLSAQGKVIDDNSNARRFFQTFIDTQVYADKVAECQEVCGKLHRD